MLGWASSPEPAEPSPFEPKPGLTWTRAWCGLGPGLRSQKLEPWAQAWALTSPFWPADSQWKWLVTVHKVFSVSLTQLWRFVALKWLGLATIPIYSYDSTDNSHQPYNGKVLPISVATVVTDVFWENWIIKPGKLAKTLRTFNNIEHIKNCEVIFCLERIGPVFPTLWSSHEVSHKISGMTTS